MPVVDTHPKATSSEPASETTLAPGARADWRGRWLAEPVGPWIVRRLSVGAPVLLALGFALLSFRQGDRLVIGLGLLFVSLLTALLLLLNRGAAHAWQQVASRTQQLSSANAQLRAEVQAHQRTERALQESELRWQFALEEAGEGVWDWNLATDSLFWSPRLLAVLGYGVAEIVPSFETWPRMVHPDDLAHVQESMQLHLSGTTSSFEAELRMRHKDGSWVWFETHAKVVARDALGKPLRVIGTQVNISTRKLADHRLQAHRQELEAQVQARTRELEVAKTAAEEANRAKSVFLANMSHELRTPMHAILAYATLGIDREPPGTSRQFFSRIVDSADRLLVVVNDLLDLSRLEAGKMPVSLRPCDLRDLLQGVIATLAPLLSRKRIAVRVEDVPEGPSTVAMVDAASMRQVFENVLSNAVRFSNDDGLIEVSFDATSMSWQDGRVAPALAVSVSDRGIGIPETELEAVSTALPRAARRPARLAAPGSAWPSAGSCCACSAEI